MNQRPRTRVDLHLHSKHSVRPSQWVLQRIGCAESYTEPADVYRLARARGMDFVTLCDHNTIDGALEIAHLPGAFVSEEVTAYFPGNECKIHVLAFRITEGQHAEIGRVRENVFDLVAYLNGEGIAHAVAHPTYAVNGRLTPGFEKLLLLFTVFEQNGTRDALQNRLLDEMLTSLTPERLADLADRHGLAPVGDRPWEKGRIGGSDDHSSLHVATTFTEVDGKHTIKGFLDAVRARRCVPRGVPGGPRTMAHNLYGIAYQFYRQRLGLERFAGKDPLLHFGDSILTSRKASNGLVGRIAGFLGRRASSQPGGSALSDVLRRKAREIVLEDAELRVLLQAPNAGPEQRVEAWYHFVNRVSESLLTHVADEILGSLSQAKIFDAFHNLGSMGTLYFLLAPYLVAYRILTKDRELALRCHRKITAAGGEGGGGPRVAHFTDTLSDLNGVARTLREQSRIAALRGLPLKLITCGGTAEPGVRNFPPVGSFVVPEYPELRLFYPPLLQMLDYCHERGFTHFHCATPGPVGLAGLAIARILKLPVYGTYHTAFPQYASQLTGDPELGDLVWSGMVWFYNQMDAVYVPSRATGEELRERGVIPKKIRFYERGTDVASFHPSHRNGFYESRFRLPSDQLRPLYVGRVSKEKNLGDLTLVFRRLCAARPGLRLIVVGDGPYTPSMREALQGLPATFTGVLEGNALAQAYASADLFVFPSTTDTFGNVVLEAQASGLPVIVTDAGGPAENVKDGVTGFVVPARDHEAFVRAVLTVTDNPALRRRLGREARAHMEGRTFEAAFLRLWESYGAPLDA